MGSPGWDPFARLALPNGCLTFVGERVVVTANACDDQKTRHGWPMGVHPEAKAPAPPGAFIPPAGVPSSSEPLDRLFVLIEHELRGLAHRRLAAERDGHTLSTTALVHETYLKLAGQNRVQWSDRGHVFALGAQAMRRILIDYARRHRRIRERVRYDSIDAARTDGDGKAVQLAAEARSEELLALDEALEKLSAFDERLARVVECRFFAGYTEEETATALGVTARTVARDWVKAKEWLYQELREGRDNSDA
jgi:RNA polymerase sigma factor (TIGR02999 family)